VSTIRQIASRVRSELRGGVRERRDLLDGAISSSDTSLILVVDDRGTVVRAGSVVEIDDELLYVNRVTESLPTTFHVERGFDETTPAAHDHHAVVVIEPSAPIHALARSVREEIQALNGSGLFAWQTIESSIDSSQRLYPVDVEDAIAIARVQYQVPGPQAYWKRARFTQQATSDGLFVQIAAGGVGGSPVRVEVQRLFGVPADNDTDLEALGIPAYVEPVIVYGAARRALATKEAQQAYLAAPRSSTTAEEVQQGASSFVASQYRALRAEALQHALARQSVEHDLRAVVGS
jgi:hypothetical protein